MNECSVGRRVLFYDKAYLKQFIQRNKINKLNLILSMLGFLSEIDFKRKTASGTNGVSQAITDKSPQLKKAPKEYKSVTGDFLEEVVSLINLKGTDGSPQQADK